MIRPEPPGNLQQYHPSSRPRGIPRSRYGANSRSLAENKFARINVKGRAPRSGGLSAAIEHEIRECAPFAVPHNRAREGGRGGEGRGGGLWGRGKEGKKEGSVSSPRKKSLYGVPATPILTRESQIAVGGSPANWDERERERKTPRAMRSNLVRFQFRLTRFSIEAIDYRVP
jgi:hypothetical protein